MPVIGNVPMLMGNNVMVNNVNCSTAQSLYPIVDGFGEHASLANIGSEVTDSHNKMFARLN